MWFFCFTYCGEFRQLLTLTDSHWVRYALHRCMTAGLASKLYFNWIAVSFAVNFLSVQQMKLSKTISDPFQSVSRDRVQEGIGGTASSRQRAVVNRRTSVNGTGICSQHLSFLEFFFTRLVSQLSTSETLIASPCWLLKRLWMLVIVLFFTRITARRTCTCSRIFLHDLTYWNQYNKCQIITCIQLKSECN